VSPGESRAARSGHSSAGEEFIDHAVDDRGRDARIELVAANQPRSAER
jgi:hypothetical protein